MNVPHEISDREVADMLFSHHLPEQLRIGPFAGILFADKIGDKGVFL
ncbi:MAG: hypothetical protein Q8P04_02320 [bacterium]|nr:hypothetical protein [bacterium]